MVIEGKTKMLIVGFTSFISTVYVQDRKKLGAHLMLKNISKFAVNSKGKLLFVIME